MVGMVCLCLSNAEGKECLQISFLFCTPSFPDSSPHTWPPYSSFCAHPIWDTKSHHTALHPDIWQKMTQYSTSDKLLTLLSFSWAWLHFKGKSQKEPYKRFFSTNKFSVIIATEQGRCWRRTWQPTPLLLPGEACGQRSLVRCCPWGRIESDMTAAT